MEDTKKTELFENTPIPRAVMTLAVPTVLSSLVMVLYNLADTYFVGMLNDPIQNAAVTLAAPVLLAFNAVNNLFGVGSSSMMSRAMGRRDYETVYRSSAFGFLLRCFQWNPVFPPLCGISAAVAESSGRQQRNLRRYSRVSEMDSPVGSYPCHSERGDGVSGAGGGIGPPCQCRNHERLSAEYCAGS